MDLGIKHASSRSRRPGLGSFVILGAAFMLVLSACGNPDIPSNAAISLVIAFDVGDESRATSLT